MRCSTTHGAYRCSKEAGHAEDCEQHDLSGVLIATGRRLDEIGISFGVKREGAADPVYRARIWARATA